MQKYGQKKYNLTFGGDTVILYIILSVLMIAADRYTKIIAAEALSGGKSIDFIPHFMDFVYVENRGAAFGMMQNTRWFLAVLTVAVLGAILAYVIKSKNRSPLFMTAASLIFAGGVGNLIDRVFFGYVTDFMHFLFIDFPCFNVADICVCTGGALFVIYLLFGDMKKGSMKKTEQTAENKGELYGTKNSSDS